MSQIAEDVSVEEMLQGELNRGTFSGLRRAIHESRATYRKAENRVVELKEEISNKGAEEKTTYSLALLLAAMGRYEQALEVFSELKQSADVKYLSAFALVNLSRLEEAIKMLSSGFSGDEEAQCLLAEANIIAGRIDDAVKVIEKQGLNEESSNGCYLLGRTAEATGEYEKAMDLYEKATEIDPENLSALFRLAYQCDINGEDERAIELYEKASRIKPTDVSVLLNLGILYEDHELYYEANDCYKRVLRADPLNNRAKLFLKDAESSLTMWVDEEELKKRKNEDEVLKIPVSDFELSVRSRNCLDRMGINSLGDLTSVSEQQLLAFKNFGETSLNEIRDMLSQRGLKLGQSLESQEEFTGIGAKTDKEVQQELDTSIATFNLSTRCRRCMDKLQITKVAKLVEYTEEELLAIPNFGRTSVNELKDRLAELGLALKPKKT